MRITKTKEGEYIFNPYGPGVSETLEKIADKISKATGKKSGK